jgi:hypothetical protein
MRALVIGIPKFQIPPDRLPGIIDGALSWHERHQDKLEAFGTFPGGGGFGIIDASDEAELNQLILGMPFSWFSDVEVRPFVRGVEGLQQFKQAVDAMAAVPAWGSAHGGRSRGPRQRFRGERRSSPSASSSQRSCTSRSARP